MRFIIPGVLERLTTCVVQERRTSHCGTGTAAGDIALHLGKLLQTALAAVQMQVVGATVVVAVVLGCHR